MRKLFFFLTSIVVFSSCVTKREIEYVDREVVKYEKQYVHDTTLVEKHDSVFHTIIQRGDTVYDTKYVERTMWKYRNVVKYDTCWKDSIQTVYTERVVVKKVIPSWCWYSVGIIGLLIVCAIYRMKR